MWLVANLPQDTTSWHYFLVLVAQIAAFTAVKCFKLAPTPLFEALKDSDVGYQH